MNHAATQQRADGRTPPVPPTPHSGPSRPRVGRRVIIVAGLALALAGCSGDTTAPAAPERPQPATGASTAPVSRAVLFGPHTFARGTPEPKTEAVTVGGANLAAFKAPFELTLRNGGETPASRTASAWVWLDGELLFSPEDFSARVPTLTRAVALRPGSVLEVRMAGALGSTLAATITGEPAGGSASIGPDGGQVSLDGVARLQFPAAFFPSARTVTMTRAEDAEAFAQFDDLASLFRAAGRTSYQVRVLAGTAAPSGPTFTTSLVVPADLPVPAGHRPELFARFYEDDGMEVLDNFQLVESAYDPATRTLTATVLADAFTEKRRSDGQFEALFLIAPTPGGASAPALAPALAPAFSVGPAGARAALAASGSACLAANIGRPLPESVPVTSQYGQRTHPVTGQKGKMHYGTDFGSATGTQVSAAADGHVERVWNSATYGLTMIVRHLDGSATLYAHLQSTSVPVKGLVSRGAPIGQTDGDKGAPTAGTSTGAHLHFEYVPNGEIVGSKSRIDPMPCIQDQNASGSLTVRDNGSAADDAFAVFLDGTLIGQTAIGASNTIGLNNLRVGSHQLRITGIVVPDGVGTYEIIVANGITFSGGATSVSGIVPLFGSATYTIDVPAPTTAAGAPVLARLSTAAADRPTRVNAVREGAPR